MILNNCLYKNTILQYHINKKILHNIPLYLACFKILFTLLKKKVKKQKKTTNLKQKNNEPLTSHN